MNPRKNFHIALIIILTCLVYFPSLGNDFVWDDYLVIARNDFVKSWHNLPRLFKENYLTSPQDLPSLGKKDIGSGEASYRPVVTLTFFADYALWGLKPYGYHLTNLILHVIGGILLYFFIMHFVGQARWAFWAALIFLLHPVQAEAVCNISFREDLLVAIFGLGAFLLFLKKKYLFSNTLFLLALFSKEMAIVFPALLVLHDAYFEKKERMRDLRSRFTQVYGGYAITAAFYLFIWLFVMTSKNELLTFEGQTAFTNFLTMIKVFATYIFWLFLPVGIHATVPDIALAEFTFLNVRVISSFILIGASLFAAVKIRRNFPIASFSILLFFISLLPVSNIIPIQNIFAPRYLYWPMAGFCLLVAAGLSRAELAKVRNFFTQDIKKVITFGLAGIMCVYSVVTYIRETQWKNNDVLLFELADYYPKKDWIHKGLADYFIRRELEEKAAEEFKVAQKINPGDLESYYRLGGIYLKHGLAQEAVKQYSAIIEIDNSQREAHVNLCCALASAQQNKEAEKCFEDLTRRHPRYALAFYNYSVFCQFTGKREKAMDLWKKALSLKEK